MPPLLRRLAPALFWVALLLAPSWAGALPASWIDVDPGGPAAVLEAPAMRLLHPGASLRWERHRETGLGAEEDGGTHPPVQTGALQTRHTRRPSPGTGRALAPAARRRSPSDLLLFLRRRNE